MKGETNDEKMSGRMRMWEMRQQMLKDMDEKELRAFITGYMMAQSMILKKLRPKQESGCGCGGQGCNCNGGSCNCGEDEHEHEHMH